MKLIAIRYLGDGALEVVADNPSLAPGQWYIRDGRTRGERVFTEYLPGFAGLNFSRPAWEKIAQLGFRERITLPWPEWSCDDYERWREAAGVTGLENG